jgi:nucleoside 2-deoxyribosyltransferase
MNKKLKIYIAGSYYRKPEFQKIAVTLRDCGHLITSSWLDRRDAANDEALSADQQARVAAEDLVDIRNADAVLSFTEPPESGNKRGGRHVELGLALAWGKTCLIIGEQEHVFHHLPQLVHCFNLNDARVVLDILARIKTGKAMGRLDNPILTGINAIKRNLDDLKFEQN